MSRHRLLVVEDTSSDDSTDEENTSHRRRRKLHIQESETESGSDSSLEIRPRKVARVTSDSSDSSDSQTTKRVRNNAKLESDNESDDDSSGWESEDVPQSEPQPSSSKLIKVKENKGSSADRSDNETEQCHICLASFKNQEVGSPDACDHSFCADCIQEWAKRVNTCPVDRKTFLLILIRSNYNGQYVRSIPVQENVWDDNLDFLYCEICGSQVNVNLGFVPCSGCDSVYHVDCLEPPEDPVGEWYCPICRD